MRRRLVRGSAGFVPDSMKEQQMGRDGAMRIGIERGARNLCAGFSRRLAEVNA
jgi:hypothetical protein